jgi:hypothetical protein
MFPNRRLSLPLMMLACSSTALASAYEIDRPESTLQLSSPYSPLLFSAFISNLAGHGRFGNDQVTARSSKLVFDLASLGSPKGAFPMETTLTLPGTSCRAPVSLNWRGTQENGQSIAEDFSIRSSDAWERVPTVTYDLQLSPASGKLPTGTRQRPETALVVDEFPCLGITSPHGLSVLFRASRFTLDSIQLLTQRDAFSGNSTALGEILNYRTQR